MKNATEVKKELYKSKVNATLAKVEFGKMYYNVQLEDGLYQFPINIVEPVNKMLFKLDSSVQTQASPVVGFTYTKVEDKFYSLSEDLGTTAFESEVKASELNRWIAKAIEKDEFIKIS